MKTAVVTGANRGIGFEACRQLAVSGFNVILTARDEKKGKDAARKLSENQMKVEFHPLDVTNEGSIQSLSKYIGDKYQALDVLINNAAIISSRRSVSDAPVEEIRRVMETNYFGPLMVTQALIPHLLKSDDARIINVSSGMGAWDELNGSYAGYSLSKVGLNALTVMFASDLRNTNIKVNSVCPGWVKTDMGGAGANRSVERGADTILWLATAKKIPTGEFFRDRREISF